MQGRIQDLKKGVGAGGSGLDPKDFLANSRDFFNNSAQKGVGVRLPLDPRLICVPNK